MSIPYLHSLFQESILEMARSPKSLSIRLDVVCQCHLFKIQWKNEVKFIAREYQSAFLELGKLLFDDVLAAADECKKKEMDSFHEMGITPTEEQLWNIVSPSSVRKQMHWRKARRAAKLIGEIYIALSYQNSTFGDASLNNAQKFVGAA